MLRGLIILTLGLMGLIMGRTSTPPDPAGLTLQEEPDRILVRWSGAVEPPMRDSLVEVFEKYDGDPRRIVIALNSPGGYVDHGRDVVRAIHKASRTHDIDTLVDKGRICASMCVPIFLVGGERSAHPAARFMFHEVSFRMKTEEIQRRLPGVDARGLRKAIVEHATTELYDDDFGPRAVDAKWLDSMRKNIRGRDVWLTGKQLMDQGSGVVDKLM